MLKRFLFIFFVMFSTETLAETFQERLVVLKNNQSFENHLEKPNQTIIPYDETIWPSSTSKYMKTIQERLRELGHDIKVNGLYDKNTLKAIQQEQRKANLTSNGIIGHNTIDALNSNDETRHKNVLWTIERMERDIANLPSRYILVNIPEYKLYVVEDNNILWTSNVIVGKRGTKSGGATPQFQSEINALVYNPSWTPTKNITKKKLVIWQKDSEYMTKHGIKVLDASGKVVENPTIEQFKENGWKLWQPAGNNNALGKLKFQLKTGSENNIYLHDTNQHELFGAVQRDFSSGCIRVEKWKDLALWISHFNDEQLENKLKKQWSERIEPVMIKVVYWTVGVENNSLVYFPDIYQQMK
jgi:murein L,D-transpeptidase YcbB/YkuD